SHVTVGESYFFRDQPLLDVFAGELLPQLIRERRAQGQLRLRVWSAGCSSGEEPYSLGMLLKMALPDIERWDIGILATDINPRLLAKAAAGRFTEWSFRGMPAAIRRRFFTRAADGA